MVKGRSEFNEPARSALRVVPHRCQVQQPREHADARDHQADVEDFQPHRALVGTTGTPLPERPAGRAAEDGRQGEEEEQRTHKAPFERGLLAIAATRCHCCIHTSCSTQPN